MKGWYFSTLDKKLRYDDNRDIAIGVTHKVDCTPVLCEIGLHLAPTILDALEYAPGPVLWQVVGGGEIVHGDDKSVCTQRAYIAGGVDISDILRHFARLCALDVIHLWDAPPVVVEYLKTGNESLRAAAGDAARAAGAAAKNAAWRAGRAAFAAGDAARAAGAAAWYAGRAAWHAGDADRDAQRRRLASMVVGDIIK